MVGQLFHQLEGAEIQGSFGQRQAWEAAKDMQDISSGMPLRLSEAQETLGVPGLMAVADPPPPKPINFLPLTRMFVSRVALFFAQW